MISTVSPTSQPRIAVYLGTFDPLTHGHFDIICRASHIFDQLIVGMGCNTEKSTCFSHKDRLEMIQATCTDLTNVSIESFDGLGVDFALQHRASVMVRGLRTEADYVYEMQMAMMNRNLAPTIETILIPTRQDLSHVSSSLVKDVAKLGGDVSTLVPKRVCTFLAEKFECFGKHLTSPRE